MSKSILEKNLSTINNRWPEIYSHLSSVNQNVHHVEFELNTLIVDDVQLTSKYDRIAEALLQSTRVPAGSKNAFIYGPGLGDLVEILLQRNSITQINVIIMSKTVFLQSLNVRDQAAWLKENRVVLLLAELMGDVIKPFCVNPAELVLADEASAQLRDRLELELNQEYIQKRHIGASSEIQAVIEGNMEYLKQDEDVGQLKVDPPKEVFIAAAGPTLEDHLVWLYQEKPFVIALDAAVKVLVKNNILPDIVVSIDSKVSQLFEGISFDDLEGVPLVYFPSVERRLLEKWRGKRFYTCSRTKMFRNIPEKYRKINLFGAGSVIHPAVDLAVHIKAKKVVLLGADFAFTHNKSHASADKTQDSLIANERARHWVINGRGEKVPTLPNFKGYLRDLERYIENTTGVEFYNGSSLGAKIEGTRLWNP